MAYVRVLKSRIPLDNSYENVITFKNINNDEGTTIQTHMTKEAYFSSYDSYFNNTYYYIKTNFKYGDTLTTELRLRTADIGGGVATGLNYVHVINTENARYPRDLFYFITDMLFLSGDIVSLKLELDVFTTYFDYTSIKDDGVLMTKRCHCNRYNNYAGGFGCEEALLPDAIDGQFSASILKSHDSLFTNYKYIILYLANNTPRVKYDGSNITRSRTSESGYIMNESGGWETYPRATLVNGYPAPYIMAVIPINGGILSGGTGFVNLLYGINENYPDVDSEDTFYGTYAGSGQLLAMQFTNFDFSDYLTLSSGMFLVDVATHSSTDKYFLAPAVMVTSLSNKIQTASLSSTSLFGKVGLSSDFSKTHMQSLTRREVGLEPKLYTTPYTRFTYTSASEKEYEFDPILISQYSLGTCSFSRILTPNPTSNGEMTFITSAPYDKYKSNYMGSSPVQNNELPVANDNFKNFLDNQKNSYYTGVGIGLAGSLLGGVGSIGSALSGKKPDFMSAGLTAGQGLLGVANNVISLTSKMSDLRNQPNKLGSTNFDIYSIVACTDTNKYINTWTLISAEYKKVADYYYLYGYEVEMLRYCGMPRNGINYYASRGLISRELFNYVQINENIVNQLHYNTTDIPLSQVVRDKFNEVFNQGVRLWFLTNANDFMNFELENKEIG